MHAVGPNQRALDAVGETRHSGATAGASPRVTGDELTAKGTDGTHYPSAFARASHSFQSGWSRGSVSLSPAPSVPIPVLPRTPLD